VLLLVNNIEKPLVCRVGCDLSFTSGGSQTNPATWRTGRNGAEGRVAGRERRRGE
jgi:hypothetical protein